MFDMLVAENLVDLIEEEGRRRSFSRVRAIRLRIGALGHVEPAALYSCFDEASEGSIAEGARLDLEMVPGEGWCPDCSEIGNGRKNMGRAEGATALLEKDERQERDKSEEAAEEGNLKAVEPLAQ